MKPRKTANYYAVYIGYPISLGRVAVLPSIKQARAVEAFYVSRGMQARIIPGKKKSVVE